MKRWVSPPPGPGDRAGGGAVALVLIAGVQAHAAAIAVHVAEHVAEHGGGDDVDLAAGDGEVLADMIVLGHEADPRLIGVRAGPRAEGVADAVGARVVAEAADVLEAGEGPRALEGDRGAGAVVADERSRRGDADGAVAVHAVNGEGDRAAFMAETPADGRWRSRWCSCRG
jgi:hypothetical protein